MSEHLLRRAASLLTGPHNYSPAATGSVFDPACDQFSVTGLVERANTQRPKGGMLMRAGPAATLAAAKARVCRLVGAPHLDQWEADRRPNWREVRRVLLEAA